MATKRIDGDDFRMMMLGAVKSVTEQESKINSLNVFPVPDGDTGTNMKLTMQHGIESAGQNRILCAYLRSLADGMIYGARGNSGVILSNFFDGFATSLRRYETVSAGSMASALTYAYRKAYLGCRNPKEGTILTVAREGIESVKNQLSRSATIEMLLGMYVANLKISLLKTPDLLPVLKEAGVVDSGGMGLVCIFEGMLNYLNDKSYVDEFVPEAKKESLPVINASTAAFNENTKFEYGYCMEFLLQLMRGRNYVALFNMPSFVAALEDIGESVVVSRLGTRIKVHVHTFKPARVIELAQNYGEFVTFKLENMCVQHNNLNLQGEKHEAPAANAAPETSIIDDYLKPFFSGPETLPKKDLYKIVVGTGDGILSLFAENGADFVLDGGPTMNTASGEFVGCIKKIREVSEDAAIVIFPNNPNIIFAAEQAKVITGDENVHIIRSLSSASGYFCIANDDPQLSPRERVELMEVNAKDVSTVMILRATRNYGSENIKCKEGDWIGLLVSGDIRSSSEDDAAGAAVNAISSLEDIADKETAVIFTGEEVGEGFSESFSERLSDAFPDIEFTVLPGGQRAQSFIIGLI